VDVEEGGGAASASLEALLQQPGWEERDSRCQLLRAFFALPRQQLTLEAMERLLCHLNLRPTDRLLPAAAPESGSTASAFDAFMAPTLIDRLRSLELSELACELYSRYRDRVDEAGSWVAARALCAAIRERSQQKVRAWVAAGAPLTGYQGIGGPLAAVLRLDDVEMLRLLLELGLPLEGSGEQEWVALLGNAGSLTSPLLQAVTSCAWNCAALLLSRGLRAEHVEESGLWMGSLLARYARLVDLEDWMSRQDSAGEWIIPWGSAKAESWICALLRRGGALGVDACEEPDETLLERLHLVERLAVRRGEDLVSTPCPIVEQTPLGIVARVASTREEVHLAVRMFGAGSHQATPGRLAMAIWCERIRRSRSLELETEWMLEPEVLQAWYPSLPQERMRLVRGEDCALVLAVEGDLDPVVDLLISQGLPVVCREGPGLLRALRAGKLERAERWIEQHLTDPEWAAELLLQWSQLEVADARSAASVSGHGQIGQFLDGPVPVFARRYPQAGEAAPFRALRHSLLRGTAEAASTAPADPWQPARRCVLALIRRAGQALEGQHDQTPMAMWVWRAFSAGRVELAEALLQHTTPWACDRHGVSLWSLWTCLASDAERSMVQQWRKGAPALLCCPATGVTEGVSLMSTLLQLRAQGTSCRRELEALAWKQIHSEGIRLERRGLVEQLNALSAPDGRSLLHLAGRGPSSTLVALLNMGLDVWKRDRTGWALGFHALEQRRAGLLEACLRQSVPPQPSLNQLLRDPTPCLTPVSLQLLKRAGADLTLLDAEGQGLVGRMLQVGRLDSLRWLLAEGLSRDPAQTSSLQANPLCQMRMLSLEGVQALLEQEPGWATTVCEVQRCLPLQQAMLVDPPRALTLLKKLPSLIPGRQISLIEQALRGRWTDQDLVALIQLLRAHGPLDRTELEELLRAHRRTFLLVSTGESVLTPIASDLRPCLQVIQEGWQPIERVGRDWVMPFPAKLVALPAAAQPDEAGELDLARRVADQARVLAPFTAPHHPKFSTPQTWLREALVVPSDVYGESWLLERLQQESLCSLAPWAQTPCHGSQEASCWVELLQGLSERAPDWPLRLSALQLARQLHTCHDLRSFLAVASALITVQGCTRALALSQCSGGHSLAAIQLWAQAGLLPPQGPLELLHTPPVPDQQRLHLSASLRRLLGRQAFADALFEIFCDAPEAVLEEVLQERGLRPIRTPRVLHQESFASVERLLVSIESLLQQGGWPGGFLDELRHALPTFWAQAHRMNPEHQQISEGAVLLGAFCNWVAGRADMALVRTQASQLGALLLSLARGLEGALTHWVGEAMLQLLQIATSNRQQLRQTVARVLTRAEDLHRLRIAALAEIGQLALDNHRLYQGAADPWLLERLESTLPPGWEHDGGGAAAPLELTDRLALPG
jgi:hypothetical protein